MVAITGASGSGKSTLMGILGALDQPTSGSYKLDGYEISEMRDDDQALIRNWRIGFVFQQFNLLARSSALVSRVLSACCRDKDNPGTGFRSRRKVRRS